MADKKKRTDVFPSTKRGVRYALYSPIDSPFSSNYGTPHRRRRCNGYRQVQGDSLPRACSIANANDYRQLAVDLATRFNGEIINGDAMQMYRGLPIITNQIPIDERNGIPHHLLSCVDLEAEAWRIGHFKREALRLIEDIRSRGKLPILVGGTHYYTQAVLFKDQLVGEGSEEEEGPEPTNELSSTSDKWPILDSSPEVLMEKLREVDPAMAERWHPRDARKIRRSLEIYFQTGRRASEIYAEQKLLKNEAVLKDEGLLRFDNTLIFWVHAEKDILNARLDSRVDGMIQQGLMTEAQTMFDYLQQKKSEGIEVDQTRGVWVSIGFKELASYFAAVQEAELNVEQLEELKKCSVESIRTATRQYGSSQIKWIRNKLWRALSDADMTRRLYIMDSSSVKDWDECITKPSESIVQSLLEGKTTPDPKSLSQLANTVLSAKEEQARTQPVSDMQCFTCDICNKTMNGEEQWNIHLNGYSHKRAAKSAARKAERDAYFRKRELEAQQVSNSEADS
jgi:tRNA dimethylallyltransferase